MLKEENLLCGKSLATEKKSKESVSIVHALSIRCTLVDSMSQIEENKQLEEMLENTHFDYVDCMYSPMGEQQSLLEETFDLVSTHVADAMGAPGMAPQEGRCGELRAGLDSCQESSPSLSPK